MTDFRSVDTLAKIVASGIALLRDGKNPDNQVVVGPVLSDPKRREWYFIIASSNETGAHYNTIARHTSAHAAGDVP
jgi:hypothetical protein